MNGKKHRILFVDDELNMLSSLRRVMRTHKDRWDLHFEREPKAAIDLALREPFDIVVTDLRMPDVDGLEMIEAMRCNQPAHTEYLLLTGNADLSAAIDAINKSSVFRFLTKPCTPENLIEAIEVALASIKVQQEHPSHMATAALAAMAPAVAVVDGKGQVIYFNESADEVLKAHKGIVIDRNGYMVATPASRRTEFQEAVKQAAATDEAAPKFIALATPEETETMTAVIMPVGQERAAVMLTIPGRFTPPSIDSLVELFGLTRVEATLAQTIASGGTVEDAARNCKVTLETARTYLKRIFQKTGVRRQVDLVQLILTTPATLVRSPSIVG